MSKFDHKKIMPRYSFIAILMTLIAVVVIGKTLYLMTAKRDYWMNVAARQKRDSVSVKPMRGNILSCDEQLMASSLPEFKLYMDFNALHEAKNDSLWEEKLDSICQGLHAIFPEKSAASFRRHLEEGRNRQSRHWALWNKRVDYNTYSEVRQLPVFSLSKYKSGFHTEEFNARQRPYGSLAGRTVGDMFGAKDTARCGLELSYDSILRGSNGLIHRRKVLNRFLDIMDTPPIDGADIVTTIDVGMQDLAERAVIEQLKEINGNVGVAIVMEVSTGDVKAIVNMQKCVDGEYREIKNHAVSDLLEPGSVFKVASIMTALDDGFVDTTYMVNTGGGTWPMYGREMRDHNWRRGGYGVISLPRTLEVSSNIGVSRIIDQFYHNDPEKFVRGIYRRGLALDFRIPLVGSSSAKIRMPRKAPNGQWLNWSNTALPWMSIGYETQIPPISTLAFYNAIANNGCMMRPRFVKKVMKNGETLMEFPPEVMKGYEQICKPKTLKEIQTILEHVVSQGLGKKAGSASFKVSGKTGTAQMSKGAAGYKSGTTDYLLSFAGYFPSEAPRYSCIVCIQKSGLPASGGGMCGPVFHQIAEGIMAQNLKLDVRDARDSTSILSPEVKNGNILAADYVLTHLGIGTRAEWTGSYATGHPVWGRAERAKDETVLLRRAKQFIRSQMPNVVGMGARDAVFLIESRGVKTRLSGRGKVMRQSIVPGTKLKKGMRCELELSS
ncbi:transpeptidase family protein [Prevotella sp. oral taxon 475]|uniref:penicillin-binding protein n=1 Tax=Prevotella sp. oral taxon 475 TaxID=712471 RepID=UPI001BA816C5|nr:penicillin-binding protein [Prevotella sp. oral taxon 475]QUB47447.1 transpeptidase family protein [Prevotella sp. oral taxon 475]